MIYIYINASIKQIVVCELFSMLWKYIHILRKMKPDIIKIVYGYKSLKIIIIKEKSNSNTATPS